MNRTTHKYRVTLNKTDKSAAHLTLPADAGTGIEIHLICEVTDGGSPALTRYQRFIITVETNLKGYLK
jgi:hypothetical protein